MVLVSAATRLRHGFGAGCGACPTSADSVSGLLPVSFIYLCAYRLSLYPLFVYFLYGLIVSLHIGFPWGVCALRALDVTSDWVSLAPFFALPGLCGLVD